MTWRHAARAALVLAAASGLFACMRVASGGPHAGRNPWTIPGVLRIAGRQDPDNLDILLGTQTVDTDLSMFWAGYLFNWSDKDELVPELAASVPTPGNGGISADGLAITYHLRRGVRWQDGAPFNADDLVYTWHQMMNPRNFVVSRFGYDVVSRIDEPDNYTVVVHLKHRFAPFVSTFFTMTSHSDFILPKHVLQKYPDINRVRYNDLPVGTGPFRIVSNEKGVKIVFAANAHYWRGPPKLQRIIYEIVPNDNTMLVLLRSHQIDFFYRAPETMAGQMKIPGTRVNLSVFTRFADLGLNAASPQLGDVRVRRALAFGTNRRALIDKVTHGIDIAGDTDQPPAFWAHAAGVRQYPYDPDKARQLLDAAGWRAGAGGIRTKGSVPLRLTIVSFTGSQTASEVETFVQEQWRRLGVDVSIKNYPSNQLYATLGMGGVEQSGKFDVAFENWANGSDPDDSLLVSCSMAPPAGWNIYHLCNRKLDEAERIALSHYDRPSRKAAYATVQRIIADELPFIVLWYQREFDVVNTDLRGYKPAHAVTPFWNTWEWSI